MALWLVRAGKYGEHEAKFFSTEQVFLTWSNLTVNLTPASDYAAIRKIVDTLNPDDSVHRRGHTAGQWWAFALAMKPGDWLVTPLKSKAAIAVAEVLGPCEYAPKADPEFRHFRRVKWLVRDVPRSTFDQDLLYSFGAFMTICEIKRNDAEKRVRALAKANWTLSPSRTPSGPAPFAGPEEGPANLELLARDQIAGLISRKFKGHGLARLVDAILRAQGYTTHLSPAGPDRGIDLLASPGALGFGSPKLCVQVKSGDSPVDTPTLNQLLGSMQNVQAEQGLLVSWSGFKSSVDKEVPVQFFRVRLWDQSDLVDELLAHYDKLDESVRAELPLKRVWMLALPEEDE